jgi:hypothetical protein
MTSNERTRVLEMVARGTITIEQADQLLAALEQVSQQEAPRAEPSRPAWQESGQAKTEYGHEWANGMKPPRPLRPLRPPRPGRAVGGGKMSFDQMIELGKYGISAEYVRKLADAGLTDLSFDEIIELGKFGVRAETVIEFRKIAQEYGLSNFGTDEIIAFGKYGIRPDYVRSMVHAGGVTDWDEVIEFAKYGISTEYVKRLQALAQELEMPELDADRIIELGKFGVSPERVREMLETGMFDLARSGQPDLAGSDWRGHREKQIRHQRHELKRGLKRVERALRELDLSDRDRSKLEAKRAQLEARQAALESTLDQLEHQESEVEEREVEREPEPEINIELNALDPLKGVLKGAHDELERQRQTLQTDAPRQQNPDQQNPGRQDEKPDQPDPDQPDGDAR